MTTVLHPITTIDAHNHANGAEIRRIHGPGEDVHDEIARLDLHADLT